MALLSAVAACKPAEWRGSLAVAEYSGIQLSHSPNRGITPVSGPARVVLDGDVLYLVDVREQWFPFRLPQNWQHSRLLRVEPALSGQPYPLQITILGGCSTTMIVGDILEPVTDRILARFEANMQDGARSTAEPAQCQ